MDKVCPVSVSRRQTSVDSRVEKIYDFILENEK